MEKSTDKRLTLPKEKIAQAIAKSKKELSQGAYLSLSPEKAFQLALEMSDFALWMKKSRG